MCAYVCVSMSLALSTTFAIYPSLFVIHTFKCKSMLSQYDMCDSVEFRFDSSSIKKRVFFSWNLKHSCCICECVCIKKSQLFINSWQRPFVASKKKFLDFALKLSNENVQCKYFQFEKPQSVFRFMLHDYLEELFFRSLLFLVSWLSTLCILSVYLCVVCVFVWMFLLFFLHLCCIDFISCISLVSHIFRVCSHSLSPFFLSLLLSLSLLFLFSACSSRIDCSLPKKKSTERKMWIW